MSVERLIIGAAAAVLGLLVTFGLPVSPRRVSQTLPSLLAVIFFFVAAFALLEWPVWLIAGAVASVVAILYRDISRFVRHVYWDVTKYTRRDFWYRRVGQAILGGGRSRSRKR
jgi:chromate transport protein ChrA